MRSCNQKEPEMLVSARDKLWTYSGYAFGALLLIVTFLVVDGGPWWLYGLPALALAAAAVVLDYRVLYLSFFALVPFSTEVSLPGGLGTDLPTEPLMLAMTSVALVLFLTRWRHIDARYLTHSITLVLLLHLCWIVISTILSGHPVISFKFLLAKLWYVIPWYGMTLVIVRDYKLLAQCWRLFFVGILISVGIVFVRFIPYALEFEHIEKIMQPCFRNHVNYASIMAITLPWLWAYWRHKRGGYLTWQFAGILFLLVAIYYSYTRAAILAIPIAIALFWIIRLRLLRVCIAVGCAGALLLGAHLVTDREWLDYAPDYSKTVTHRDFDDLISATAKGEDISTMERVYRWVAGGHMISERPIAGFGPGTFYQSYRPYTVSDFQTYVSDNPQKSGIHSYYLMTWVDQGSIGFLIFMLLTIWPLIYGERLYHQLSDATDRLWLMAALLSLLVTDAILVINDMLEVDKTGPFYFISLAIIVQISQRHDSQSQYALDQKKQIRLGND